MKVMEITGIDYPEKKNRFELRYILLSYNHNQRIIMRTSVDEKTGVDSISSIMEAANWMEREIYDMFGIVFKGHKDLRRILTDYGFRGHPLRKEFPVGGFSEVRYDEEAKRIVNEKIEYSQEYRAGNYYLSWKESKEAKKELSISSEIVNFCRLKERL